mgnify:FL=1
MSPSLLRNPHRQTRHNALSPMAIVEKAKERHEEAMTKLGKLREQAAKCEAELQRLLEECTTKIQATEKEVVDLQVAIILVAARLAKRRKHNN